MAASTTNPNVSSAVANSAARLRFFLGQRLTQRDLADEQHYHVKLRRLMQRELFGTGTVAGLGVNALLSGAEAVDSVVLGAGLAVDPDGRELLVEHDLLLQIAAAPMAPGTEPFPPTTTPDSATVLAGDINDRFDPPTAEELDATDVDNLIRRLKAAGLIAMNDPAAVTSLRGQVAKIDARLPNPFTGNFEDWLFDQLVGVAYLGLRYSEDGKDPAPAIVDASCCAGVTCFPTRTQEGVVVAMSATPFPAFPTLPDPHHTVLNCLGNTSVTDSADCDVLRAKLASCVLGLWRDLPPVEDVCGDAVFPTVPLAAVYWSRFDHPGSQILNIDNVGTRPLALGVATLRALVESLAGCVTGGV